MLGDLRRNAELGGDERDVVEQRHQRCSAAQSSQCVGREDLFEKKYACKSRLMTLRNAQCAPQPGYQTVRNAL